MEDIVLKTDKLTKKYGKFTALDSADIVIRRGSIYGLIGRNGAGKTTLMKMIAGLSDKTDGSFELFGRPDAELENVKKRIGCLIENPAFFPNMTAYQNLRYYAIQKGIVDRELINNALKTVKLDDNAGKKFKSFSLGMKQRLGIAFAIMDNPDFVILDEPINGLDPIGISEMRDTIKRLNEEEGVTFLISSHILSELYSVAESFCIIEKSKIIKQFTKEELDAECGKCIEIQTDDSSKAVWVIENVLHSSDYKVIDKNRLKLYDHLEDSFSVNRIMIENGINVYGIVEKGLTLEDYFITLVEEVQHDV